MPQMRLSRRIHGLSRVAAAVFASVVFAAFAVAEGVEEAMREAAKAFLASLDEGQSAKARHAFDEGRKAWHYVPKSRNGLSLKDMAEGQRALAFELLRQGLSEQGIKTVKDVISLEDVLRAIEGDSWFSTRDPELYFFWIFGSPDDAEWGWRFEGHHISINATVVAGIGVSMTPTFLGANPAEIPSGPRKGFRALPAEEDVAMALIHSLDEAQRDKAVFDAEAPSEIFTRADRKARPLPVEGIEFSALTPDQQAKLKELVSVFLTRNRPELADETWGKIERSGWANVRFGWAGSLERTGGNYYYVQGADFLIEYDNTQNNSNHIHTALREFDGDFGEDLLSKHHRGSAH